ncbi:MAG: HAMP domain-containing histidine kinase [Flavobacteriaceae bacterium]|nr:HAMP domain-containing histidine kinase [Flavobacteriaceae bacterium]
MSIKSKCINSIFNSKNRFILLLIIMIFITIMTSGVLTLLLYEASFNAQKERLVATAQSQARLIEAIARFDATIINSENLNDPIDATITQIVDAHKHYKGFGQTGEFTLAKKENNKIVWILPHRHHKSKNPEAVNFGSNIAEPMSKALSGFSGTMVGYDYRGIKVLAAFEPVQILNLGIVAKIDLSEIRTPFIESGMVGGLVGVLLIITGIYLFRYINELIILDLIVTKDELRKNKEELEKFNLELEDKIEQEVQRNLKKDQMMVQQSRYAQMGELVNMIAHQWRQPLNIVSTSMVDLSLCNEMGQANYTKINETTKFVELQTQKMSKIINDFMNFFKPEKEKENFMIKDVFKDILDLIGPQLKSRGVKVELDYDDKLSFLGYKKELEQIIINLIANSRDAYDGKPTENKFININIIDSTEEITFNLADQAGGIEVGIINRIFDPYFTSKEQGKGTGIGLYMTKNIIEKSFDGTIGVINVNKGVQFTISLPK